MSHKARIRGFKGPCRDLDIPICKRRKEVDKKVDRSVTTNKSYVEYRLSLNPYRSSLLNEPLFQFST